MNATDSFRLLYKALCLGDEARVRALMAEGADINVTNEWGWPLLLMLVEPIDSNSEAVHLCLKCGADPTREWEQDYSLISELVSQDCYKLLPRLLDEGFLSLDSADSHGRSILMWYAISCDSFMAEKMLDRGASVHQRDKKGITAFAYGFDRLDTSLLERMLKAGADINERNAAGHTALMVLAQDTVDHRERMRFFLEHGADVNLRSPEGKTALGYACDTLAELRQTLCNTLREQQDRRQKEEWLEGMAALLQSYGATR